MLSVCRSLRVVHADRELLGAWNPMLWPIWGFMIRWGVNYQPYAAGRMKNLWGDDAEEFRPERFLTATDSGWVFAKPSPYKFSAFQAGKRICLGMDMAYLEAKTAVVLLMQKYRFSLSKGHEVCRYGRSITLTIENFRMDIKPNLERPPTT